MTAFAAAPDVDLGALAKPFADWGVTTTAHPDDARVLTVTFHSPS